MKSADPAHVITAARSWLGTPYHDQASLRGVGCDCLGLARGVWREVIGPEPFPIPPYSRDWGETGPREVLADRLQDQLETALEVGEKQLGLDLAEYLCSQPVIHVSRGQSTHGVRTQLGLTCT